MAYKLSWLADVLRAAELTVIEEPGWQTRGHGDMGTTQGVICHHTAGPRVGNSPSLKIVRDGRAGLSGPLAQLFLARDGTYHVVAAGKSYHAGTGSWQGVTGNASFIGIEAENTGLSNDQPWPADQYDAYLKGCAALLTKIKAKVIMCCGHKEYATPRGRKTDPTFDMFRFRNDIERLPKSGAIHSHQYTVADGDTLYRIALVYGMKLNDLLAINHLTLGSVIHPGDRLSVT